MNVVEQARDTLRPCSYAQRWLWTLNSALVDPSEYNVFQAVRVGGPLDLDRLRAAAEVVSGRHELLRTRYRVVDGELVGVVSPVGGTVLWRLRAESVDAAIEQAKELVARPFDLAVEHPVRIWAIELSPTDWVVVVCLHHIAVDAWSMGILWRELSQAYNGESLPPPTGPSQAEIVRREADRHHDDLYREDLQYWREELAGWTPLDIPTDRPRPARRSGQGAQVGFTVPDAVASRLAEYAASSGSTVFLVATAAVMLGLSRWTGRRDVAVGTAVSCRDEVDLESAVGYSVNTVVIRGRLTRQDTVADFVGRVRDSALEAFSRVQVPFAEVVREVADARDRGRNPIVDVMVDFVEDGAGRFRPDGLAAEPVALPAHTVKFDLSFTVTRRAGALTVGLVYATDLFDEPTARRLAGHVETALAELCAEPSRPLWQVRLLGAAERHSLVRAADGTDAPIDPRRVDEIVADWARRQPHAPAVRLGDQFRSYGELDRATARVADRLVRRGIRRGDRVAVRLGRSVDLPAAILGVLRAGAAYVPVDSALPAERIRLVLADSEAAFVLTDAELADWTAEPAEESTMDYLAVGSADEPAYVMHTSGSTGRPKGVVVPHRGVVNLSSDLARRFGWGPGEVVAAVAPHSFDMSVAELLCPLVAGATVRVVPREAALDAARLAGELREVSFAQLSPTHWRLLLDHGWSDRRLRAACGAEVLPPALAARLVGAVGQLWNVYGPTETTVWSTAQRVRDVTPDSPVPVGRPLANTVALVLDEDLFPVPVGAVGELCLGGAGLAHGYHGAPGLTAERFVPDPVRPGHRLYRTGDLVRRLADGTLEFRSRADDQVKVRGFRIEPAEVEAALERHPDVVRAAAAAIGEDTERRLVAFLVLRSGGGPAAVRQFAAGLLPGYLMPAAFVPVDSLPLSPNGKIDRRLLPRRAELSTAVSAASPPRTACERLVARVFGEVLGLDRVGAEDDFFALGGHSLDAIRVVTLLEREDGRPVSAQLLFDHSTVESLAARLDDVAAPAAGPVAPPFVGRAPLSFAQRRLWLLDRFAPGRTDYNVTRALRLTGHLDADALELALRSVAVRHDILRSSIVVHDGTPVQIVDADPPPLIRTPVSGGIEAATALAAADSDASFELASGPLWRARLVRISDADHLLVLVFHHIVIDGGSFPLLWRQLAAAYRGESLPRAAFQYADHAREQVATPVLGRDLEFWRAQLVGRPATELVGDRPRPQVRAGRGADLPFAVGPATAAGLRDVARAYGVTVFGVAFAAFAVVLSRFCGAAELVVGTPSTGRDQPNLDELIGCFVNTLVLRVRVEGDPSLRELLDRVHTSVAQARGHQGLPFERLVDELAPARDAGRTPLFQIMFLVADGESLALPGVSARSVSIPVTRSKFDLTVELHEQGGGYDGCVVWDTDIYDRETAASIAACYQDVLVAVARRPHDRLSELAPTTSTRPPEVSPAPLWLDSVTAARLGGRPAVHCGRSGLSYAELDRRSDAVAGWLRARGIGRGSVVSVVADGVDLPVLLLGVAKAGAAFLPVDPLEPPERVPLLRAAAGAALELRAVEENMLVGPVAESPRLSEQDLAEQDLAGVYFTSGSTGPAKAVHTTHGGISQYFRYLAGVARLTEDDRVLQLAAPGFDASLRDLFGPLAAGARVVLLPSGARRDAHSVVRTIRAERITAIMAVVPSMLRALVAASGGRTVGLRLIMVSGEILTTELAREVARWAPEARLVNQYGPSETTMTATFHEVVPADLDAGVIPVGRPIPGVAVHVLGRHGERLPPGAVGIAHLSGPGLARGYGSAAATAERFVPNPHGRPGERMFRTGDRMRWRADGRLTFHGRDDAQIKIRGVRIEPAEVEAVLGRCPELDACAVGERDGDLVAYLVGAAEPDSVRAVAARLLPVSARPARYLTIDALPLLSNGKLDRRALAALGPSDVDEKAGPERPARDMVELTMTRIWARVLGRPVTDALADFFALGGNSLNAVELVEAVRAELGVGIGLPTLFAHPTLDELCALLPHEAASGDRLLWRLSPARAGSGRPLFLLPPQSGSACCYLDLVRAMDSLLPDCPLHGVDLLGHHTDDPPRDRIEAMAARCLAEVRRVQPVGPYAFAGWSFGGNLAFEMAHQAESAGERVEFLGVIDARVFGGTEFESPGAGRPDSVRFALAEGLSEDELTGQDDQQVLRRLLAHAHARGAVGPRTGSAGMARMVEVFAANGRAAQRYRSDAIVSADLTLFRAGARHPVLPVPLVDASGWRARTRGRFTVHDVPGTHHDVVSADHAAELAALLVTALRSARAL
jgi:amino acid adenylation domain-containing protein